MARLIIAGNEYALNSYWYHYRESSIGSQPYSLIIPRTDKQLMDLIEAYAECAVNDVAFEKNILKKDVDTRSIGLIWNLSIVFEKNINLATNERLHWVINNIRRVAITETDLILTGDVVEFDESKLG